MRPSPSPWFLWHIGALTVAGVLPFWTHAPGAEPAAGGEKRAVSRPLGEKAAAEAKPAAKADTKVEKKEVKTEEKKGEKKAASRELKDAKVEAAAVQVNPFEKQCEAGLRKMLRTELHFFRLTAQPAKDQYDAVVKRSEAGFAAVLKQAAAAVQRARQGGDMGQSQPRALLIKDLTAAARAALTPEQVARYQAELDRRAAAEKRVAIELQLLHIDKLLLLSDDQRGRLAKVLEANWKERWNRSIVYFNTSMVVSLPDKQILPLLTPKQRETWNGLSKGDVFYYWFDVDPAQGIEIDDEPWEAPKKDAEPKTAAAEPKGAKP